MATVQISDIYNALTFGGFIQEAQKELNRFVSSGVAVRSPQIDEQKLQGGRLGQLTGYAPLTYGEPSYTTDDNTSDLVPRKLSDQVQEFRMASRADAWSTMDLARELALQDPVAAITSRIGGFWAHDDENRIINSLLGVLADNDANDSDDMFISVASDASDAVADTERINSERILDALQTMGDHAQNITAMAVHSAIHTRLKKLNLIDYIPDSEGRVQFESYQGKRLVVDDNLPAVAGSNRITYTCILFAAGAVVWGNGRVNRMSEVTRNPLAGDGGGEEILISRIANVWHPVGFTFKSATLTGHVGDKSTAGTTQPGYADLKLAANWDRVFTNRKSIPLAFLKVND